VSTPLPRSPRAALPALAALSLIAGAVMVPTAAQAADRANVHKAVPAHSAARDAAELQARAQEREALRASRLEEREAARAERQALREERRAARAQERGPRGCRVTIQTSAARITAGESVTVFGKVTCPADETHGGGAGTDAASAADGKAGGAASGLQVTIEQSTRNHEASPVHAFAATGSVSTEADGSYQLAPVTLDANTVFRARLGRHGAHTSVHVAPVVTLNAPTAAAAAAQPSSVGGHVGRAGHDRLLFTGTVAPAATGARVALQVSYPADGEQWHTIAYGHVIDGGYSIVHGLRIPGEAKLRVLAHPRGANSPGASEAVTYTVPQSQNPQLTIQASANPLTFGQAVTLSGVAAGAAGQTVTLLARTKGAGFTAIATSTTDEAGAYQFAPQEPQQNTYYEVSDSATRSVALFVGVKFALTLSPPPTAVTAGEPLTIDGSVAPASTGATVYLERGGPSGLGFHPIASSVVGKDGTFSLAHAFEGPTTAKLRVRVTNDSANLGSASPPFVVTVGAGAATALAPEPEPAPAGAG